jgi:general stress protein YciG
MKKTRTFYQRIGKKGGKSTSPAKLAANAANAKKGGWPKGRPRKKK